MAACTGFGSDEIQIRIHTIGDKNFAAIEHPSVTLAFGCGANACNVRTGAWLCDAHSSNRFASNHIWQIFSLLRRSARMVQMGTCHIGMYQDRDDETRKSGLRQRFCKHQIGQCIGFCATVFALIHQTKKARVAHTL